MRRHTHSNNSRERERVREETNPEMRWDAMKFNEEIKMMKLKKNREHKLLEKRLCVARYFCDKKRR